jgi:acyl transferase domain-containing protein
VTSLLKAMLELERGIILPNRNFETPNPKSTPIRGYPPNLYPVLLTRKAPPVPFEAGKLTVPTEPKPWPFDRAERVGVNSFGIGGANAHVRQAQLQLARP